MNICIFGAALDTSNLGVSALGVSAIETICSLEPDVNVWLFDYGEGGVRRGSIKLKNGSINISKYGAVTSYKFWRRENIQTMRLIARIGGFWHRGVQAIRNADLALDVTGGDSFTDLYGAKVFNASIKRKQLVLEQNVPLILLPQTYGPFMSDKASARARDMLLKVKMAWSRDEYSFETLRDMLGPDFNADMHRCGVDMAFNLSVREPAESLPQTFRGWLEKKNTPLIGINVNGIVYNMKNSREFFGHKADYRNVVHTLLQRLLKDTDCRIIMVPHVICDLHEVESDVRACMHAVEQIAEKSRNRIEVLDDRYDQNEIKWIISKLDWFCGTRMHSTIAGLSTCVPTATIAYSIKAKGVFKTCGQEEAVADLRLLSDAEIVDKVFDTWKKREKIRAELLDTIPAVINRAVDQMQVILSYGKKLKARS